MSYFLLNAQNPDSYLSYAFHYLKIFDFLVIFFIMGYLLD